MTATDACFVVLAEHLDTASLTDQSLVDDPTIPAEVPVFRLPASA